MSARSPSLFPLPSAVPERSFSFDYPAPAPKWGFSFDDAERVALRLPKLEALHA
ncbi:hypothetical protein [Streptomyces sp. NBC_01320]|uniref:hypothetical protein n=1 Tax=Streptomyces sp. NBC_01320 TaxID=2903824 RepID=UPI002E1559CA|nr:hypothetical protein OG395_33940 [Streptomyces sp. NBC_01320]